MNKHALRQFHPSKLLDLTEKHHRPLPHTIIAPGCPKGHNRTFGCGFSDSGTTSGRRVNHVFRVVIAGVAVESDVTINAGTCVCATPIQT